MGIHRDVLRAVDQREVTVEEGREGFAAWVSSQLLAQLRSGGIPGHARVTDFVWEPFLSQFRAEVQASDKGLTLRLLRDPKTKMWGAFLSRGILSDEDITKALTEVFASASEGEEKLGLFHHLAARNVDEGAARTMYDWVCANLDLLLENQRRFFAPADTALERVRARIQDPFFRSKRWVYLFSAHAAQDSGAIRKFVEPYLRDPDPLVAEAAALSLAQLK